ncbi:MAG: helix-turn-helix domain-containing protein [Pirellulales bacterium]
MPKPTTLSQILRQRLIASGIPHKRIEREAGVSRDALRRLVNGELSMRLRNVDTLARYLGLELTDKKKR